jgi:hypothetical protein
VTAEAARLGAVRSGRILSGGTIDMARFAQVLA